jgi:uncharacterized Zn finger protein
MRCKKCGSAMEYVKGSLFKSGGAAWRTYRCNRCGRRQRA